jgi:FHA domain
VLEPAAYRHRLARTLNSAYAEGLLSERTLAHRLDILFASALIDPARLVGDLWCRGPRRLLARRLVATVADLARRSTRSFASTPPVLLALDWSGAREELLIGRHPSCDVVIPATSVSRRHALLTFRDGGWIIQDLDSTNGTRVNGQPVGRCCLRPGDHLVLADQRLQVD